MNKILVTKLMTMKTSKNLNLSKKNVSTVKLTS